MDEGMKTPLEIARERERNKILRSCHDCRHCVKVMGWWYCEDSGKMLHPMMLERICPLRCSRAILKEEAVHE